MKLEPAKFLAALMASALMLGTARSAEIHDAARADDVAQITAMLATNKDLIALPGKDGMTPLHFASREGKMNAVVLLLEHGADVNSADTHGCTPLHSAVYGKHLLTVEYLLNHRANVNATRKDGTTPLFYAAGQEDTNLVSLLLRRGAQLNVASENGSSPLHAAAHAGHAAIAEFLVAAGANIESRDQEGRTPLHVAAAHGHRAMVEWLLNHGADADAKTRLLYQPLDYVNVATNAALATLLEQHMKSGGHRTIPAKVGEAGDPDHLGFEGLQRFTAAQIRRGLMAKPSYMLASHPQANMGLFLESLKTMVESGFQAAGFPDAKVEVHYDSEALQIRVKAVEGARFIARKIQVAGTKLSSSKQLLRWFTTPAEGAKATETLRSASVSKSSQSADGETTVGVGVSANVTVNRPSGLGAPGKAERPDGPMWVSGEPADFSAAWATQAVRQVESCLAEQGFFFPKAKVELQRDAVAGVADLQITVMSEGPPGVIGNLKVTGAQRDKPADILRFLDLRKGAKVSARRLAAARQKLWDCGRFWSFAITPEFGEEPEVASRHVNLRIEVNEQDGVPRLKDPLSPVQQALVRLCKWLEGFPNRDEDIHVTVTNHTGVPLTAEFVLSPKRGLLLSATGLDERMPLAAGFLLTPETVQLCSWALGGRLASPRDGSGNFIMHLLPVRNSESNRFNFTLGAGYKSAGPSKPMLEFDVLLAPAAFLDVRSREELDARIEGRWLVVSSGGVMLRAEAATGRVIAIDRGTNLPAVDVRFNAHAWEHASRDFTRRAAALTNFYVPDHGMSSLLGFAVTELARWQLASKMSTNTTAEQQARAVAALRKLVNPQYFYAVETYLGGADTNRFGIPVDDLDRAIQGNSFAAFSGILLDFSREYFPKYSWPWTVTREMVFNFMSLNQYTDAELQRLYTDEETGPIGCLAIASAFGKAGSPLSKAFAMEGLLRMGQRDFLRDCSLLLRGDSGLARSFGRTVEALRDLPEDEVAALAAVLPEAEANLLRESAVALRAAPDGAPASVLAPALGKYWEESLRGKVRRALQKLTVPSEGGRTAGIGAAAPAAL